MQKEQHKKRQNKQNAKQISTNQNNAKKIKQTSKRKQVKKKETNKSK